MTRLVRLLLLVLGLGVVVFLVWHAGVRVVMGMLVRVGWSVPAVVGTIGVFIGVESIRAVLPIAPSTYFRHKAQQAHPARRSEPGAARRRSCARLFAASGPSISRCMGRARSGARWAARSSVWRAAAFVG